MSSTRNCVGSLPGNTCVTPLIEGNAMILAGQRRQQCVEANLFLYFIGEKINSEIMGIFLKKPCLVIGSAHVSVTVIYQSPLALIYRHIWLRDWWLCRDWWLSPVTLLLEGKNCGMAEGCYGLNRADGSISVAALRPPCQGKAHRGPAPMTRRLAEFESQATQPDPVLNIVIMYCT